jgi:hypothetical protein
MTPSLRRVVEAKTLGFIRVVFFFCPYFGILVTICVAVIDYTNMHKKKGKMHLRRNPTLQLPQHHTLLHP